MPRQQQQPQCMSAAAQLSPVSKPSPTQTPVDRRSFDSTADQEPRQRPVPGRQPNAGGRGGRSDAGNTAPAQPSSQKAEKQWRTYLHTREGLAKEGLIDSTSSSSGGQLSAPVIWWQSLPFKQAVTAGQCSACRKLLLLLKCGRSWLHA
jgi:hypothetical protein